MAGQCHWQWALDDFYEGDDYRYCAPPGFVGPLRREGGRFELWVADLTEAQGVEAQAAAIAESERRGAEIYASWLKEDAFLTPWDRELLCEDRHWALDSWEEDEPSD